MDRDKFLDKAGFRSEVFRHGTVELTLSELSMAQRRAVLDASVGDAPMEAVAALTVAMSCPEFSEDDIETLIERVRPEILVAAAQRVFELSNMVEGSRESVKKPLEQTGSGGFSFRSLWPWGAQSRS